jgi:hypothetical protein
MRAAVVNSFDTPPTYQDFPTPTPQTPDEVLIDVIAVGLHPRVRSQANGSHYTSSGELPLIPVRCGRDCRPRRHARRGRPAPRPDSPRRRRGHRLPLGPPHGRRDARHRENRTDRGRPLTWIEIGSVGGPTAAIPSAALRAARLQIVGSGQGSVPTRDILAGLLDLATEITGGTFQVNARAVALADVAAAWDQSGSNQRLVITP